MSARHDLAALETVPDLCGTYAGYQRHTRRNEPHCQPCKDAANEYQREWRSDPENREATRRQNSARNRALWRLSRLHRADFQRLYVEELRELKARA